ncbi:MAG: hypothetical protein IJ083_06985 [Clostridia bacterium]|nr:hypothetical protein [Clostridia bacterium]
MFLRKFTVMTVPLLLMALLALLLPVFSGLGFFGNVFKGLVTGIFLALLLPLSGASRMRERFMGCLWVPVIIGSLVVILQYVESAGTVIPGLSFLSTRDGQVVYMECTFIGYMLLTCVRTME